MKETSKVSGKIGTTSEEVEIALGMRHQTVSARRSELRHLGLTDYLLDNNEEPVKRLTSSGSPAYVEIGTKAGVEALKLHNVLTGGDPTAGRHGGNPMSQKAFESSDKLRSLYRVLEIMLKRTPSQLIN